MASCDHDEARESTINRTTSPKVIVKIDGGTP